MEKHYLIKESTLENMAEKIRTLRGGASPLTPQRMAEEIEAGADDLNKAKADLKAVIEGVGEIYSEEATSIAGYKFYENESLLKVEMPKATKADGYAFSGCTNLVQANFPSLTVAGQFMFDSCEKLVSVNLPLLKRAETYAMRNCKSLTELDFDCIEWVGAYAFNGCSLLETLILRTPEVVELYATNALNSTPITDGEGYVYVPAALVTDYELNTNWKKYNFRAIEDYPEIMGYKWERRAGAVTYLLSWDGGTTTTSGYSTNTITVYSECTFNESTGKLTVGGSATSVKLTDLKSGYYRVVEGVIQQYASKIFDSGKYVVTWNIPKITRAVEDGTDLHGYVTSRDPNRYPDNGKADDGFTYIKIAGGAE